MEYYLSCSGLLADLYQRGIPHTDKPGWVVLMTIQPDVDLYDKLPPVMLTNPLAWWLLTLIVLSGMSGYLVAVFGPRLRVRRWFRRPPRAHRPVTHRLSRFTRR